MKENIKLRRDFIVRKSKLLTIGKLMENTLLKYYFKWLSTCTNINFHQKYSQKNQDAQNLSTTNL